MLSSLTMVDGMSSEQRAVTPLHGGLEKLLRPLIAERVAVHLLAIAVFAGATAAAALAQQGGRPITAAIAYLLGVTIIGGLQGVRGGLVAAIAASLIYNFFLSDPVFTFTFETLEDYAPLVAFNLGAGTSGLVAGRLKDRALAAELATGRLEALLELSKKLQAAVDLPDVQSAIAGFAAVDGLNAELFVASSARLGPVRAQPNFEHEACHLFESDQLVLESDAYLAVLLLSSEGGRIGVLVLERASGEPAGERFEDLRALANLVSIAVERCQLHSRLSEAELVRKSEEFKTALLSSVSHDMRTPLSAISTSASSLAEYGPDLPENARTDLLDTIQEQCHRLNRYTTNLLNLGRLQAGLDLERFELCDAIEVLGSAIIQARRLDSGHQIAKRFDVADATVRADPVMLEQVFQNILENAIRYSEPSTLITISAQTRGALVSISIRDEGRGIAPGDFSRIFDRFFQAGESRFQEGSGLGLAIAKGFTEAFGGRISAALPDDERGGSLVTVELPLAMFGS